MAEEEVDLEELDLTSFFTCEEYSVQTFEFGDRKEFLKCSTSSSTDHDLTGQIVWPASLLLAWFVHSRAQLFRGRRVLELGAGCGLGGICAAHFARRVTLTDGNDVVLRLLAENARFIRSREYRELARNSSPQSSSSPAASPEKSSQFEFECEVRVEKLMWGVAADLRRVCGGGNHGENKDNHGDNHGENKDEEDNKDDEEDEEDGWPDVVIGADVILWPALVNCLLATLRALLAHKPRTARAYISYVERAQSTTALLRECAREWGLRLEEVRAHSFIPAQFLDALERDRCALTGPEKVIIVARIADPADASLLSKQARRESHEAEIRKADVFSPDDQLTRHIAC